MIELSPSDSADRTAAAAELQDRSRRVVVPAAPRQPLLGIVRWDVPGGNSEARLIGGGPAVRIDPSLSARPVFLDNTLCRVVSELEVISDRTVSTGSESTSRRLTARVVREWPVSVGGEQHWRTAVPDWTRVANARISHFYKDGSTSGEKAVVAWAGSGQTTVTGTALFHRFQLSDPDNVLDRGGNYQWAPGTSWMAYDTSYPLAPGACLLTRRRAGIQVSSSAPLGGTLPVPIENGERLRICLHMTLPYPNQSAVYTLETDLVTIWGSGLVSFWSSSPQSIAVSEPVSGTLAGATSTISMGSAGSFTISMSSTGASVFATSAILDKTGIVSSA